MRKSMLWTISGCLAAVSALALANAAPSAEVTTHATRATAAAKSAGNKSAAAPVKKLAPSNLSLAQIVEKNVAARGGAKAWHAVQTLSMTGTMDAGRPVQKRAAPEAAKTELDRNRSRLARIEAAMARAKQEQKDPGQVAQVPFMLELKRPRKMRLEIRFAGDTAVQTYDGAQGWKLRPYIGRNEVEAYSSDELKIAAHQTELDGALIDYAAKGYKLAVEGMEPVDGHNAYRLKATLKDGAVRHIWVDAKTFLEVQIDETRHIGERDHTIITAMRDYRTVNGLKLPFLLETRVPGVTGSDKIHVEKVAVNTAIADARFGKPTQATQ